MRPRILISGGDCSRKNYENAVLQAGGEPYSFYLPALNTEYDALVLGGGTDPAPAHYGQRNTACTGIDPARDAAELALIKAYLAAGKPILGICRGQQMVNIALGGDLIQDLGAKLGIFHGQDPEGRDRLHPVRTIGGSLMQRLYGDVRMVNSAHHQAVGHLGKGLCVSAVSECGIIEALEHLSAPVVTVQWHPERLDGGEALFAWLIERCRT